MQKTPFVSFNSFALNNVHDELALHDVPSHGSYKPYLSHGVSYFQISADENKYPLACDARTTPSLSSMNFAESFLSQGKAQQRILSHSQKLSVYIAPAMEEHIEYIATHMREVDVKEVFASHRHTPHEALLFAFGASQRAWTAFVNNTPACMFGVCRQGSIISEVGVPWLLATDDIRYAKYTFLKYSQYYIAQMQQYFPRLENLVYAQNTLSMRWLTWCGFRIEKTPVLINNEPFFTFWRQQHV